MWQWEKRTCCPLCRVRGEDGKKRVVVHSAIMRRSSQLMARKRRRQDKYPTAYSGMMSAWVPTTDELDRTSEARLGSKVHIHIAIGERWG